jgi:peptidoglycan/xylan/chitin deacetylase (PgdA/CDA1 family)
MIGIERGHRRAWRSARIVFPATAVLTVLTALAGCGSGSSGGQSTATARATATATSTGARPATATTATAGALPTPAAQQAAVAHFAGLAKPIFCGGRHGKLVALTFDDGPGPYTHYALSELGKAGARATFFLVGKSVARFPQLPPRERSLAAIGEHTMTHPDLPTLAFAEAKAEIAGGRRVALDAAGPPVDLFRPPYGAHDDAIDAYVGGQGMAEILWDVDSTDSRVSPPADYREISATVRRNVRPGSIVLMHENRGQTIRALRGILPVLKRRGLRSVTVPELLAADPPTAAQLKAGRAGCGPVQSGTTSGG